MKLSVFVVASALLVSATSAFAWGSGGYNQPNQFAHGSATNLVKQVGQINAHKNKGLISQETGADAAAINRSKCGCKGNQTSKADAKNVSLQVATINAGYNSGGIYQSSYAGATAKNVRGR
jgi:hypothetical protein